MAKVYRLYVGITTALALCKYCLADWNATDWSANRTVSHHHGNRDNYTDSIDAGQWNGHFSQCPEELKNYCIHGECRYIAEQKAPSCRCQRGFVGSRCEYVELDWLIGERGQIIIIAGLIFLILLIIFICICSHRRYKLCQRRGRRREQQTNGTEKLSMIVPSAAHADLTPDSTEPALTSAV